MAVKFNTGNTSVVIPTIDYNNVPYMPLPQPTQSDNKYDPKANYAKALGFLPIDTRYLSNTTNNLAYNSMADVLLNKEAWNRHWGNSSWLNTWYGYLPRVIADTALLTKNTTIDPIMQGIIDDGFQGALRGLSTGAVNTLVNFGNTLDILSNPIKGLVLEGARGFEKGLFGDSDGRKQYDYNEYINTGNGLADLVLSLGAETVSDPLNWLSLGVNVAAKSAASGISKTAINNVSEFLTKAVKTGVKTTADDIAEEVIEVGTKKIAVSVVDDLVQASGESITKTTAARVLADLSDDTGQLLSKNVDDFIEITNNLTTDLIAKTIRDKGVLSKDALQKTAQDLAQSKATRYKAGLVKGVTNTPTIQRYVSEVLPNIALDNLPAVARLGVGLNRFNYLTNKTLSTIGSYGSNFALTTAAKKGISAIRDLKNISRLKRYAAEAVDNVTGGLKGFDEALGLTEIALPELKSIKPIKQIITPELDDAFESFYKTVSQYSSGLINLEDVIKTQQDVLKVFNNTVRRNSSLNTLSDYINDLSRYINKIELDNTADVTLRQALPNLKNLRLKLQSMDNWLNKDLTNSLIINQLKQQGDLYNVAMELWKKENPISTDAFIKARDDVIERTDGILIEARNAVKELGEEVPEITDRLNIITEFQRSLKDDPVNTIKKFLKTKFKEGSIEIYLQDILKESEYNFSQALKSFSRTTQQLNMDSADKAFRQYRRDLLKTITDNTPVEPVTNLLSADELAFIDGMLKPESGRLYDFAEDINKHYALPGIKNYPNSTMDLPNPIIKQNAVLSEAYDSLTMRYEILKRMQRAYEQAPSDETLLKFVNAQRDFADEWDYFVKYKLKPLTYFPEETNAPNKLYALRDIDTALNNHTQKNINQSAASLSRFIDGLPLFELNKLDDVVDIADYAKAEAVSYVMRGSQTHFAFNLINNFEDGFGKLLEDFANPESQLNKLLNNPAINEIADTNDFKLILSKCQSFKTLTENVTTLARSVGLDDAHIEGLMDALVSEINKNHGFPNWKLNDIANNIYNTMNLYFNSHMDIDSYAMDTLLQQAIKANQGNPIAEAISKRLGKAHAADVDVQNLIDLLKLNSEINDQLVAEMKQAGKKYRVILDIETTGTHTNSKIYQLSGQVLDDTDNVINTFDYHIDPGNARPDPLVLQKLATEGEDANLWWLNNVVNHPEKQSLTDAMQQFKTILTTLDEQGGFILVGHNIEEFDIPKLIDVTTDNSFKQVLNTAKVFDTYTKFVSNDMFTLSKDTKDYFISKLVQLLNSDAPILKSKIFTAYDVSVISDFKKALRATMAGSDVYYAKIADSLNASIESSLDNIVQSWNLSRNLKRNFDKYYTLSKATNVSETMQGLLDELTAKGFINVVDQHNIITYLNRHVTAEGVFINPKMAISYQMFNIFSLDKVIEQYGSSTLSRRFAENLTQHSRKIMNIKTWLTPEMTENLTEAAETFLSELSKADVLDAPYVKLLYNFDTTDPTTIVATALFYHNRLKTTNSLSDLGTNAFHMFDDMYRWNKTYERATSFVTKIDPKTGKPVQYYNSDIYDYVKIVKDSEITDPIDAINKHDVNNNLYDAHKVAIHNRHHDDMELAKAANATLKDLDLETRIKVVSAMKKYEDTYLVQAATNELLNSKNRVQKFINESYLCAGRKTFIAESGLDLSDFEQAGIIVARRPISDALDETEYFLGLPKNLFLQGDKAIRIGATITVKPKDIPDTLWKVYVDCRIYNSKSIVNIGTSHGDILTRDLVENFDNYAPAGFSKQVISVEDLMSEDIKFFDTTRANNMIIGDHIYQSNFDEFFTTDPFKRTFKNTEVFIKNSHNDFTSYLRLLLNDANGLRTSDLFKDITSKDTVKLFKQNPDMHAVIIRPASSKWRATSNVLAGETFGKDGAFGYILEDIPITSVKALEYAKQLNAHILPEAQFLQISKAINQWELPTIAKYAKGISSMYAVGMLGATGFVIRNFVDSNYKNHMELNGIVSIPDQLKHLWQTYKLVSKYNDIGQLYSSALGKYFASDLDYSVLYHYVKNIDADDITQAVLKNYDGSLEKQVLKRLNVLKESNGLNKEVINKLKDKLIEPKLFDVVNHFVQDGPSAGLARSVYNNIAAMPTDKKIVEKMIDLYTNGPAKLVFNANDMVEQTARLSLFLQRLEFGDNIDDAIKSVIKTHFDYSDKSLGMLYTEIVFPFMSFSYKNMNYWIETVNKNPMLVRELENILRPCLDYQSLWEPNQEVYENYDYTFDWQKDVVSFEANAPWQIINAARLYHLLQGNIVMNTNRTAKHDNGYGEQEYELYRVFKLSPSILDAVSMLYNPINVAEQRLLPPYEILSSTVLDVLNGKKPFSDISLNTLLSSLPFVGAPLQRLGNVDNWSKSNNISRRVKDVGLDQAIASLFTTAYVSKKENRAWYDALYNYLNKLPNAPFYNNKYYNTDGGFTPVYAAKKAYQNPYETKYPNYTISKAAHNKKPIALYTPSKKQQMLQNYPMYYRKAFNDNILKSRVKDYKYYY